MGIKEKILLFLKQQNGIRQMKLSKFKVSSVKNKSGENLLFISASLFEDKFENFYSNTAIYYAFDFRGNNILYKDKFA